MLTSLSSYRFIVSSLGLTSSSPGMLIDVIGFTVVVVDAVVDVVDAICKLPTCHVWNVYLWPWIDEAILTQHQILWNFLSKSKYLTMLIVTQ